MKQFYTDVAAALSRSGIAGPECFELARRAISEIETALLTPESFAARLGALTGRYRTIIDGAVGRRVRRLLITPVPSYLLSALPEILVEFPTVILADNFKAGAEIAGRVCVTLDEAMDDPEGFDAFFMSTVDQRLGRLFRNRLPPERTIGASDIIWSDPHSWSRPIGSALSDFAKRIATAKRPLLVLSAYLDSTVGPTLEALGREGVDVFVITRRLFSAVDGINTTDPAAIGADRHYVAEFDEMLWLLRQTKGCPVLVNYARFFASNWDFQNTIPLFAYSIAILNAIAGPKLLHLYDAYQVCMRGLEAEVRSFALYRDLLDLADGIVVNSGAAPVLRSALGATKPIIGFLRYGPDVDVRAEPDPGPFSIAMITGFLGEGDDPTRMTAEAVRSLLQQGIHVHYYSADVTARRFAETLSTVENACFHIHEAIRDQGALVAEISHYDAGWFVADMACCEALEANFTTPFARTLARHFVPTAVATAGILYGCAGLPSFFNRDNCGASLFPEGGAIEISLDEVAGVAALIDCHDWKALRAEVVSARAQFTAACHVDRLAGWLQQFHSMPVRCTTTDPSR